MQPRVPALVKADGLTPLRRDAAVDSNWPGASFARGMRDWRVSRGSADGDNGPEADIAAWRGRDLERHEGQVYSAIQQQVLAIVGEGLDAVPTPDWKTLGKDKLWAEQWSRVVRGLFRNWARTTDCDASRTETLGFMGSELLTSTIVSGSGVAVPYYLPDNGLTRFGTCFRVVEADRLSNPDFLPDTATRRRGIELDPETGAPKGYWICSAHPGDALGMLAQGVKREWTYIPAFTSWGRRRLVHVYPRRRPEQSFGISQLASVGGEVRDIGKIRRAELRNQVVTSALALIVKSSLNPEQVMQMFKSSPNYGYWQMYYDKEFRPQVTDDGATVVAPPGTEVTTLNAQRNAQNFEAFLKASWRQVMAGLDIPYEIGARDYGGLNYSNARTILLDAWRTFYTKRTWMGQRFFDPVFQCWFEEAVHLGLIPDCTPELLYAPGMATAWTACRWLGSGKGWIDPLKEAQAQTTRMGNYTTTMLSECGDTGEDWMETADQQEIERAYYHSKKMEYPLDVAARNPRALAGAAGDPREGDGNSDREH
ncbi:phage portal protein [Methylobacterium indicum]|uniref:Phage portal protein n=1 Tax=Methylobacterium indicum TaxID=1775910 RepID=A0A8H9C670_9HYPH|nr:phage portal protein [Methylobacterium indicum]BCM83583.1 phage portal protein [Methylobacterium indicum]